MARPWLNPKKIRGKIYAQFVQEVKPEQRNKALEEVQKVASIFNKLKRDNRDYHEIALGVKRDGLK